MAKFIVLVLVAFNTVLAFGQKRAHSSVQGLFDNAEQQIDDSLYDDAIASYKKITQRTAENSTPWCKAFYNMGYTYFLKHDDSAAREILTQIVDGDFDDMDRGGRGSGLMQEPYALYKHNACELLAEIAFRKKNFSEALEYIQLFDTKYPYQHFCGNEMEAAEIYTAEMYSRAYLGLQDTTKAIRVLLPYIFDNGLAPNTSLVNDAIKLLQARYEKNYLSAQLNNAIDGLTAKTIKEKKYQYEKYQIVFLDVTIDVPDMTLRLKLPKESLNSPEVEKRKLSAKASDFYARIGL